MLLNIYIQSVQDQRLQQEVLDFKMKKLFTNKFAKMAKKRTAKQKTALKKAQKASAMARKKKGGFLDNLARDRNIARADIKVASLQRKIAKKKRKTNKRAAAQFKAADKRLEEASTRFMKSGSDLATRNMLIGGFTSAALSAPSTKRAMGKASKAVYKTSKATAKAASAAGGVTSDILKAQMTAAYKVATYL
jgi:hypothetical protein